MSISTIAGCSGEHAIGDGSVSDVAPAPDEASPDGTVDAPMPQCWNDTDCDDHLFCTGVERCVAGRCDAGSDPCDDARTCTRDACNETTRTCSSVPDDARCSDSDACNGIERCAPGAPGVSRETGCTPPASTPISCDDGVACTVDLCDHRVGCIHAPLDRDLDGHVSRDCTLTGRPGDPSGDDCDDSDPTTYPTAAEICDDARDNDCDGDIDTSDISGCRAGNDLCVSATVLTGPGTYAFTTIGLVDDYVLTCNTGSFADAVVQFTITETKDVELRADTRDGRAALALLDDCSSGALRCARGTTSAGPDLVFHSLPAGTYYAVVETGATQQAFGLTFNVTDPTPTSPSDLCDSAAIELNDGLPHSVGLVGAYDDYLVSCRPGSIDSFPDLAYRLTLTADSDVTITGSAVSGATWLSLRSADCTASGAQIQCAASTFATGYVASMIQRHLAAGTYWVIAEAGDSSAAPAITVTAQITSPPAPRPLGEACPTSTADAAIDIDDGAPHIVVMRNYDDDYLLSCNTMATAATARDAVVRLALSAPSDVRITGTAPSGATILSLRSADCADPSSELRCVSPGTSGPGILYAAALPAGTYWVVIENSDTTNPNVVVQAQITSPPMVPANDACPLAPTDPVVDITDGTPQIARMQFLSDDYRLGCRAATATLTNNAQDAVFRLSLSDESDVDLVATRVSSATSSVFVSLRRADCDDAAPELRCLSGSPGVNSTVRSLAAGTYWVVVESNATVADDVVVSANVRPAASRVPGDFCPGVPVAIDGTPTALSRTGLVTGTDIGTSCGTGSNPNYYTTWTDGVFNFTLPERHDVFVTAFPTRTNPSSVYASLQISSACDGTMGHAVSTCSTTPTTTSSVVNTTQIVRGLEAGTYYAVVDAPGSQPISDYTLGVNVTTPSTGAGAYTLSTPSGVSFVDACTLPGAVTVLPNITNGTTAQIPRSAIPFALQVYGLDLTPAVDPSLTVSPQGWLAFMPTGAVTPVAMLGAAAEPNLFLSAFSRSGLRTNAGGICYGVTGVAPNRQFVVEWNDLTVNGTTPLAHLTFEIIVNEAEPGRDNLIDVVYQTITGNVGTGTAGMESEASGAVVQDTGPFTAPRIVRYTHTP